MDVERMLERGWILWVTYSHQKACYTAKLYDADLNASANGLTIAEAIDNLRFADIYNGSKPVRPTPLAPLRAPQTTRRR